MFNRKIGIAVLIAFSIVLIGLYWNQTRTPGDQKTTTTPNQKKKPSDDQTTPQKVWNISSEAQIQVRNPKETPEKKSPYDYFTIPGRVHFPENVSSRKVRLKVQLHPVTEERASEFTPNKKINPIKQIMRGGPDKALKKEKITRYLTTNTDGKFNIKNAIPGIYSVTVEDTGWSAKQNSSTIQIAQQVKPIELELQQNAKLIGHVYDENGNPLQAQISFTDGSREFQANKKGKFTVENLKAGEPIDYLLIKHDGYLSHFVSLPKPEPGETIREDFTLETAAGLKILARTPEGKPITNGKFILNRKDDKTISFGASQSIPHGEGKIAQLDENGIAKFTSLQPGKVEVGLSFTNYLSNNRVVTVEKGKTKEIVFEATRGEPFTISFTNQTNGQPAEDIQPAIKVFNSEGELIDPGFEFVNQKGAGSFKGAIHPEVSKIKVKVTSPHGTYRPKQVSFRQAQLPDLHVKLTPRKKAGPPGDVTPPGLVRLRVTHKGTEVNWDEIATSKLIALNAKNGNRIIVREGKKSSFKEPLPLNEGKYHLYGLLEKKNNDQLVALRTVNIKSSKPGSRTLKVKGAASLSGSIELTGDAPGELKAGISFLSKSPQKKSTYPGPLSTEISKDGSFTFDSLPANKKMVLHVLLKGSTDTNQSTDELIHTKTISPMAPGSERSISSISIQTNT